jgi:endonuclease YncB( thermonuclease family)
MEYGDESRNELVKLIGGKCVTINVYGTDQYGRYLGDIYCDGIFIQVRQKMLIRLTSFDLIFLNWFLEKVIVIGVQILQEEMLKRGFAWYFKTGEKRPQLARVRYCI